MRDFDDEFRDVAREWLDLDQKRNDWHATHDPEKEEDSPYYDDLFEIARKVAYVTLASWVPVWRETSEVATFEDALDDVADTFPAEERVFLERKPYLVVDAAEFKVAAEALVSAAGNLIDVINGE